MIKLWLRADSEQDLITAVPELRGEGGYLLNSHNHCLVILGELYANDGTYNQDGAVVTPPTRLFGYHANLICTEDIAQSINSNVIIPTPLNPLVDWF